MNNSNTFAQNVRNFNCMYGLPVETSPALPDELAERLRRFKITLMDEVHEVDEIVQDAERGADPMDLLVALADWLGDITVYCRSEAMKMGLPLEEVLAIIMESNLSKLGADGQPIYDANGKVLKGPGYWKPEPRIRALLEAASL